MVGGQLPDRRLEDPSLLRLEGHVLPSRRPVRQGSLLRTAVIQ